MSESHKCSCQNCGRGCSDKKAAAEQPKPPVGFFAARPWIWILLGYLAFVGALSAMVVVAVKHSEPDVRTVRSQHGH